MEKVRILSFDPGTASTGYAMCEGNLRTGELTLTDIHGVIVTKKSDGNVRKRVDIIGMQADRLAVLERVPHIVIEDFTTDGTSSRDTDIAMATLIEHLRMRFRILMHVISTDIWSNHEWKRIATGRRGLNKKQIEHFVRHNVGGTEVLGSRQSDIHVWDAVGMCSAKWKQILKQLQELQGV